MAKDDGHGFAPSASEQGIEFDPETLAPIRPAPVIEECGTCRFCVTDPYVPAPDVGACRRRAPTSASGWPLVALNMWCGEYEKR